MSLAHPLAKAPYLYLSGVVQGDLQQVRYHVEMYAQCPNTDLDWQWGPDDNVPVHGAKLSFATIADAERAYAILTKFTLLPPSQSRISLSWSPSGRDPLKRTDLYQFAGVPKSRRLASIYTMFRRFSPVKYVWRSGMPDADNNACGVVAFYSSASGVAAAATTSFLDPCTVFVSSPTGLPHGLDARAFLAQRAHFEPIGVLTKMGTANRRVAYAEFSDPAQAARTVGSFMIGGDMQGTLTSVTVQLQQLRAVRVSRVPEGDPLLDGWDGPAPSAVVDLASSPPPAPPSLVPTPSPAPPSSSVATAQPLPSPAPPPPPPPPLPPPGLLPFPHRPVPPASFDAVVTVPPSDIAAAIEHLDSVDKAFYLAEVNQLESVESLTLAILAAAAQGRNAKVQPLPVSPEESEEDERLRRLERATTLASNSLEHLSSLTTTLSLSHRPRSPPPPSIAPPLSIPEQFVNLPEPSRSILGLFLLQPLEVQEKAMRDRPEQFGACAELRATYAAEQNQLFRDWIAENRVSQ